MGTELVPIINLTLLKKIFNVPSGIIDHCSTLCAIRMILLIYVSDLHINNIKQDNF